MAQRKLQLTLAILKPDLVCRPRAAWAVKNIIAREGFHTVRSARLQWGTEDAKRFYSEHRGGQLYILLVCLIRSHVVG